jgi:hypothetical protein
MIEMRDYFVFYAEDNEGNLLWHADDPGGANSADDLGFVRVHKVFVRVPTKSMLLAYLNSTSYPQSFVTFNFTVRSFASFWSGLFGGDFEGGYLNLADMPSSDAFGFIHGRPARDEDGKFIVDPYR